VRTWHAAWHAMGFKDRARCAISASGRRSTRSRSHAGTCHADHGQHDKHVQPFYLVFFPLPWSVGHRAVHTYRVSATSCASVVLRNHHFPQIALPKTLPEFFGALKVSVTLAFIGTNLGRDRSHPTGAALGHCSNPARQTATTRCVRRADAPSRYWDRLYLFAVVALDVSLQRWGERPQELRRAAGIRLCCTR